jgi:hypothetical protein
MTGISLHMQWPPSSFYFFSFLFRRAPVFTAKSVTSRIRHFDPFDGSLRCKPGSRKDSDSGTKTKAGFGQPLWLSGKVME